MIKCRFCGIEFEPKTKKAKCCSYECSYRYANSLTKSIGFEEPAHKSTENQLTDTAIKARQENITYGQYQAMKYLKERMI